MAVAKVTEVTNRDTSADVNSRKRYMRQFQVLTDTQTDGAKQVLESLLLPAVGDVWEEIDAGGVQTDVDTDAFCVERRAMQSDGDNLQNWMVTCSYVGVGDPTLEPAVVSFGADRYQETTQKDRSPVPKDVRNSAEDFYEAGLTRDRTRRVLHITKNVLTYDPHAIAEDTVNLFPFLVDRFPPGFAPGTCKLDSLTADAVWYADNSDIHYWKRHAQISIDRNGWNALILDAGFHAIIAVPVLGNTRGKIVMTDGSTPTVPQPLDGAGGKLAVGGTPVYNSFVRYEPVDWSALNLEF